MDNDKLRTYLAIATFVIFCVISVYLVKNIQYLKRDPCDACERATGFKCQNFNLNIVKYPNGSLYHPIGQGQAQDYSQIDKLCKQYEQQKMKEEINLSNLIPIPGYYGS